MRGKGKNESTHTIESRMMIPVQIEDHFRVKVERNFNFDSLLVFTSPGPLKNHANDLRALAAAIVAKADELEEST